MRVFLLSVIILVFVEGGGWWWWNLILSLVKSFQHLDNIYCVYHKNQQNMSKKTCFTMKYHISEPQAEVCGDSINRGIAHSLEMSAFVSGFPDSFNLLKSSKT